MLTLITRADDDYWYQFKDIKTIEDIFKLYPRCVVEKNHFSVDEVPYWEGFKQEDIPNLKKAKCHILIYNSYIE
jgi:hypothetical protein